MAGTFASEHLAKALSCRAARYGECAFCKDCDIPNLNGIKLCRMPDMALMEMAAKQIRAAAKAQKKIVKTMKKTLGDVDVARCVICEYSAQCRRESQGDANDDLRFWRCVDGSEFKFME
jgi:hypothetical protein